MSTAKCEICIYWRSLPVATQQQPETHVSIALEKIVLEGVCQGRIAFPVTKPLLDYRGVKMVSFSHRPHHY